MPVIIFKQVWFLRDGDLGGGVVVQAEGPTLQHLEAEALALVAVDVHGHDGQRQLPGILHLEALPYGEQRLVGAQACRPETHARARTHNFKTLTL